MIQGSRFIMGEGCLFYVGCKSLLIILHILIYFSKYYTKKNTKVFMRICKKWLRFFFSFVIQRFQGWEMIKNLSRQPINKIYSNDKSIKRKKSCVPWVSIQPHLYVYLFVVWKSHHVRPTFTTINSFSFKF